MLLSVILWSIKFKIPPNNMILLLISKLLYSNIPFRVKTIMSLSLHFTRRKFINNFMGLIYTTPFLMEENTFLIGKSRYLQNRNVECRCRMSCRCRGSGVMSCRMSCRGIFSMSQHPVTDSSKLPI